MRLNGDAIDEVDERGERITGDTLVLLFNAGERPVSVRPAGDERGGAVGDADRHRRSLATATAARGAATATSCSHARWRC